MALRNVVIEGDEILRKHCREVTEITDRIRQTMEEGIPVPSFCRRRGE